MELACWCDFRIVAENARIGLLNKRWGLSLADALQVEVEICHPPVRAPEVVEGMASFVAGSRPEPPRPRDSV